MSRKRDQKEKVVKAETVGGTLLPVARWVTTYLDAVGLGLAWFDVFPDLDMNAVSVQLVAFGGGKRGKSGDLFDPERLAGGLVKRLSKRGAADSVGFSVECSYVDGIEPGLFAWVRFSVDPVRVLGPTSTSLSCASIVYRLIGLGGYGTVRHFVYSPSERRISEMLNSDEISGFLEPAGRLLIQDVYWEPGRMIRFEATAGDGKDPTFSVTAADMESILSKYLPKGIIPKVSKDEYGWMEVSLVRMLERVGSQDAEVVKDNS